MAEVQMGLRKAEKDETDKLFTPIVNFVKDYPNLGPV